MIVAAALCPWPPLLARDLTGLDPVLPELRAACEAATERLVRAAPEVIAVLGPAAGTRAWDPAGRLDPSVFAPSLVSTGDPELPPSLGLGAMLLDRVGYTGHRLLQAVSEDEPADRCASLGTAIASSATAVGLLAMGDGSARRSERAPGYLDERAAAFDAETERAVRAGDFAALLALDPGLARELMATGRPVWQVLAGAIGPARPGPARTITEILYRGDPFGVAYLVAFVRGPGRSADDQG